MTGLAIAFCGSPESRCPCGLSLICDHIGQLFQAQDERSTVMNGACDLQTLECQGSGQQIVLLACRCLGEQGVDEHLALLVSQLLVTLQASFQQETRTRDVTLAQGNLAEEAHKPARDPCIAELIMDGESLLQEGLSFCLIALCAVDVG